MEFGNPSSAPVVQSLAAEIRVNKKHSYPAGKATRGPSVLRREDTLFNSALGFHQNRSFQQAEAAYRHLLAVHPQHVGALHYLGILAHQTGRSEEGIELLKGALEITKRNPELHFNLALIYSDCSRDEEAIRHNRKALRIKPDYADAHTNLAVLMLRQGDTAEAVGHFKRALLFRPSSTARENLAKALLANGDAREALSAVMKGLSEEDSDSLRSMFALVVRSMSPSDIPDDAKFQLFLVRAIAEAWCRPSYLSGIAGNVLLRMSPIDGITNGAEACPAVEELAALQINKLLIALLNETPNSTVQLELMLTSLRRFFLELTTAGVAHSETDSLALMSALASQCFINEYVFAVSDFEMDKATKLLEEISQALDSDLPIAPHSLAMVACYFPLNSIRDAERLAQMSLPVPVRGLVKQQILDPREDRMTQLTVHRLTSVTDETSQLVREQYEQNPYPRWVKTFVTKQPLSVDQYIRTRFPSSLYRNIDDGKVDLLIAGCGTGIHAIERAAQFRLRTVLAIDLSLASLSYAIRKTREFGLTNLQYVQADIMAASEIGRTFNIIDSTGVLHHLRQPFDGWQKLLSLLSPAGLMHIGLYSSTARRDIRGARELIEHRNLDRSIGGIRSFRQKLMHLEPGDPLENIARSNDFFSMSECRDLLFHVQEHQFDLSKISTFLDDNELNFLGFETLAIDRYMKRFPEDKAAVNLNNWHLFESENPRTFAGMYQFWVQKRT